MRPRYSLLMALWLGLWLLAGISPGLAQQSERGDQAQPATAAELQDLVEILEDETARRAFVARLRTMIEAQRRLESDDARIAEEGLGAQLMSTTAQQLQKLHRQGLAAFAVFERMPGTLSEAKAIALDPERRAIALEATMKIALILAFGLFAEWLARRLLQRTQDRQRAPKTTAGWQRRLLAVYGLILITFVPLFVFAAAAYGLLPFTQPRETTELVILAIVNANVLTRAVTAVARIAFSPKSPESRLLRISEETAHYWVIWVRRLANLAIYGYFLIEAAVLLGLAASAQQFFLKLLGLLVLGLVVVLVLQNKAIMAQAIKGRTAEQGAVAIGPFRRRLADSWHVLAIVFLVVLYAVWLFEVEGGFRYLLRGALLSLLVLAVTRLVLYALQRLTAHGFRLSDELKRHYPGLEARTNQYLAHAQTALRFVVKAVALLTLLQVWGVDVAGWVTSDTGSDLAKRLAALLLVFFGAYLLWEVVSFFIERYLERRDDSGATLARSARTRTLLPLLRNVVRVILLVLLTLTVLSELGIDIAPLLAGAGVVGLAIGFGAQSLVKDVITGIFVLLEDALSVGDYVELGSHMGTVESMTIRSVKLRDLDGNVHFVPFGEVTAVLNMAKEFGISLIDVSVAYRENVDEVIEVLKEIGAELEVDEIWGPHIREPYEVLGLHRFDDSAVVIRTRFKTEPMMQWALRREFHLRMKRVFDERGIEIPYPHQTVYFGVDKEGKAPGVTVKQAT